MSLKMQKINHGSKNFFADYQQETATSYAETLRRIQEAILFIRRQGGSGKIREWQRQSLQLPAFEDSFQEQTVIDACRTN